MIWVVFDQQTQSFIPVYWVLMTGKTSLCYDTVFHAINNDLGGSFKPAIIGIDFELAFINMCTKHWPDAHLIGCYFHFTQAMVRYMKDEVHFPKEVIPYIREILQLATVLPPDDLPTLGSKGWVYLGKLIDQIETGNEDVDEWLKSSEAKTKKGNLYKYIQNFWLRPNVLGIWNCHLFATEEEEASFRTNCWIESLNRTWNERFGASHPSLGTFVETLRAEQRRILDLQESYRSRRDEPPIYGPVEWPEVPDDYEDYVVPKKSFIASLMDKKKKRRKLN